jgi:enoyl-CoA hydratase/carnithine racemase
MNVLVDRADGVMTITLNRPDRLNAINTSMVASAIDAIENASDEDRVIALTGAGRAFCAGADISGDPASDAAANGQLPDASTIDAVNRLALAMTGARQLVIAVLNGPAVGVGSSIALGADIMIASERAYLKTGFEAIGLMPDGGGTAYLASSLGRSRAMAIAVLGDRLPALEAQRAGLIARVFSEAEFPSGSRDFLVGLAAGPTRAQSATKRAITALTLDRLPEALEFERNNQRALLSSEDFAEGTAAFNEKRTASFHGR